jgi:vacuolar-type H+-ATPase subunit H
MSEKTLELLIASLKTEAIDAAEQKSKSIIDQANHDAQKMLDAAKEKRDQMLEDAEKEAQSIISNGKNALRLAAKNFSAALRNDILNTLQSVLSKEVEGVFTPDLIKEAIVQVIKNIGSNVELKLSKEYLDDLSEYVHQQVQLSEKLVITEDNSLLKTLSITKTDQGWSYRISPEEITEALLPFLTSNWNDIIKNKS